MAPKLRVLWSPAAISDLADIGRHLAREASPTIAESQLRSIDRAASLLAQWPFMGKARDELAPELRSIPIAPYVLYYRPAEMLGRVDIVRVLHGRRDVEEHIT